MLGVEECRAALENLLGHEIFLGARRLSEFCRYCGTAALEGRTDLDQYEIAAKVLGRANDFNPLDDAAVRKLATQLRHKLDAYYAGPGASDPVVVSLPRRSYLLRFRPRGKDDPVVEPVELSVRIAAEEDDLEVVPQPVALPPPVLPRRQFAWKRPAAILAVVGLAVVAWQVLLRGRSMGPAAAGEGAARSLPLRIETQRGDIRGKELDVTPDAVRLGPALNDGEEAMVRLRFTPEHVGQTAGLMLLYDPDHYVRLGPHLKSRSLMEFGVEREGVYRGPESSYMFDPQGQTGQSRWLAIRRAGSEYSAFLSADGFQWNAFGARLQLPDTSGDLRTAVYAFNGRSANPPAQAAFEHFGAGLGFHHRADGPFEVDKFPGWELNAQCKTPVGLNLKDGALEVGFTPDGRGCASYLLRPAPVGDFALTALIDFEPVSGSSFGITIQGSKASAALTRRDLGGRSIQLERLDDNDTRIPDYPGAPPVVLRMEKRGAAITASVSRDYETYRTLPGEVKLDELGRLGGIGLTGTIAHWTVDVARPPARVYWVHVEPLAPDYLSRRNVP